ncbi:Putative Zinc finger, CCCH-type [Septoria linicola]|uniref:Zinc finger, CCCH-type n=1 Tax=Septoria linicola TaxID=215465 RepID=A0A9Q9AVD8_9PEZI|nr:putative Zinc finger, CCCH-type [Septoria linicola]USW53903.1 Putative Zinc finger, CCCH-type [Septoria linicola]
MAAQPYTQMPGFLPGASYHQRSSPSIDGSQPRLTYFITRTPSGLPVPLIPADELPFTVKLHNVSRVLQPQDTYGLQYVGTSPYTGTLFKLDPNATSATMQRSNSQSPNEPVHVRSQSGTPAKQFLAPDALARQAYSNSSYSGPSSPAMNSMRSLTASEAAPSWRRSEPIDTTDTQGVIDAILRSEAGAETAELLGYRSRDTTPPPSGILPDQDKKVFCTHWIMTGDCKFVQQGCRYKHEMPSEAKLKELGIRHTPRWWQEQNASIKLGGMRNIVGSGLKPLEMLNMGKGDEADDESSSDESEVIEMVKQVPVKAQDANVGSKQILKSKTEAKSPVAPPTRPSSPVMEPAKSPRKPSTTSDLIDFTPALASVPAPPPAPKPTTRPAPPSNPRTTISIGINNLPGTPAKTTKVFVPAGDSPEHHIADMKKRERITRFKQQQSSTPSPSQASTNKSECSPGSGLQASKHAPQTPTTASPKRSRAGCRIRRPAVVSPVAKVFEIGSEKKEKA